MWGLVTFPEKGLPVLFALSRDRCNLVGRGGRDLPWQSQGRTPVRPGKFARAVEKRWMGFCEKMK